MSALDRIAVALENLVTLRIVMEGRQNSLMTHDFPCGHVWAQLSSLQAPRKCPHCEAIRAEGKS